MKILELIKYLEENHVEEDIKKLSEKDRLNFYVNIKEFEVPKIQRTVFEANVDSEVEILIRYEDGKKD